jgi:hypothetical protein
LLAERADRVESAAAAARAHVDDLGAAGLVEERDELGHDAAVKPHAIEAIVEQIGAAVADRGRHPGEILELDELHAAHDRDDGGRRSGLQGPRRSARPPGSLTPRRGG